MPKQTHNLFITFLQKLTTHTHTTHCGKTFNLPPSNSDALQTRRSALNVNTRPSLQRCSHCLCLREHRRRRRLRSWTAFRSAADSQRCAYRQAASACRAAAANAAWHHPRSTTALETRAGAWRRDASPAATTPTAARSPAESRSRPARPCRSPRRAS